MKFTSSLAALSVLALSNAAALIPRQSAPRTPVTEEKLQELLFYTRYAPTYPQAPCMILPENTVVQGFANTFPRTQVTLFRSDVDRELVMAFPGTAGLADFLTDIVAIQVPYISPGIDCRGCRVHVAVLNAWNFMEPRATEILDEAIAQFPDYKIKIVGHSLGGAISNFAFNGLVSQGYNISAVYSYGQFRVGNPAFADFTDGLSGASDEEVGIYNRVTHADDGVPQILPTEGGFRHPRTEYWFQGPADVNATVDNTFQCNGQEPTDCNNSQPGLGLLGINEAHINYPELNVVGCGGFGPITEVPF